MSETSEINYDLLVQEALRGVVRDILARVAEEGLPGSHHFYVAFKTRTPGVQIPERLRQRYPDEMTIVLQHRFWGLTVYDDRFEVGLSFNQKPEHLIIPFEAVIGFVDPSVQFALQFQDERSGEEDSAGTEGESIQSDDAQDTTSQADTADQDDATGEATPSSDNVVTLDQFRKKS